MVFYIIDMWLIIRPITYDWHWVLININHNFKTWQRQKQKGILSKVCCVGTQFFCEYQNVLTQTSIGGMQCTYVVVFELVYSCLKHLIYKYNFFYVTFFIHDRMNPENQLQL